MKCTLTTPMYGGGVTPGEVDSRLPIRPGALRGQLRFWWRLLNGASRDPREVFAAESELWGGIASAGPRASRVALHVAAEPVGSDQMVKSRSHGFPAYALILDRDDDPHLLAAGYEFTLTARFGGTVTVAQREQTIEAMRWWASFGGVGARTRRGLGTVTATSKDVQMEPVSCEEVESRGGRMVLRAPRNAIDAWKDAVDALKHFRQGSNVGRNAGSGNRPGRSRWPEPDTIRKSTGRHAPGHEPEHKAAGHYPRAAFGLPIVFHFKSPGDPKGPKGKGVTLNPADGDRMASPLILRSYFDGAQYHPLALLLPGWEKCVSVSVGFESTHVVSAWPEDPDERTRWAELIDPMRGRGADSLSAFMHYFNTPGRSGHGRRGR